MGSDEEKAEKKRLKAQYKLEKKRMKVLGTVELDDDAGKSSKKARLKRKSSHDRIEHLRDKNNKLPWYKNPEWVRAIVAIISLVVTILAIIITLK